MPNHPLPRDPRHWLLFTWTSVPPYPPPSPLPHPSASLCQCAGCLAGSFTRSQFTGLCTPCPGNSLAMLFVFALVAMVVGYILYRLYRKGPSVAALTIAVDYFQILALFASLQVYGMRS